jgi:membrane protease YdiL (CAAX protease family)
VGFGPQLLLYAAALGIGASTKSGAVTVGSAVALVIGSLVIYGWQTLAAWFFSLRIAGRRLALWGFTTPSKAFFWTIPVALAAVYLVSFLHDLVVHPRQQHIISQFPRTAAGLVLFVILAVFMAPLFEEVFFRGFLFRGFSSSWGWMVGACVSAAIFGLAHLQVDVFVPLFALGIALAWVYKRTGSLWTSIAFHALFNALSVLAWWLSG